MLGDLRVALRGFRHNPGFSVLAVTMIALGAGANAAVFSVVRAVLIDPLPYARPDGLVSIAPSGFVSNGDLDFLRTRAHSFEQVAASSPGWTMSMIGAGDPVRLTATKTSANLFDVLGVRPLIGRTFAEGEDLPGRTRVAILSYALWNSRFAGDLSVIGRTVTLEDAPHQIIGVMGPDFELHGRGAELWTPLPFDRASPFWKGTVAQAIGRLRDGVDAAGATRELQALVPDWQRQLGYERDWGARMIAAPLRDSVVGDVRPSLILLTAAVGLILMLTAANLGTLFLGRHVARRRELAVRSALGASTARLSRQTIVESLALAVAGVAAGACAASAALPALVRAMPDEMPRLASIRIDSLVLVVVLVVSAIAVLAFGALPSLFAVRPELQPLLRLGSQSQSASARRSLNVLVVGQVSLAVILGAGAALMTRSLLALQAVNPGFDPVNVLSLKLQPPRERAGDAAAAVAYYRAVMERIAAIPGVERVGAIHHLPLSGYNWLTSVSVDGQPVPAGVTLPTSGWRMVIGPYFETMRIPLVAGRTFDDHDTGTAPAVVIVNEVFARNFFGTPADALGRKITMHSARGPESAAIVGVVGSVRHVALAREAAPELYRPVGQSFPIAMALTVRTSGAPASIAAAVRQAVWSIDPAVPIADMAPLPELLRATLARPRLLAMLLLVFASVGLAILLSGVYGVVAYTSRRREREIGIRLALGAAPSGVVRLVMKQGVVYAIAGLAVGAPVALALTGLLRGLLYGIEPRDPMTILSLSAMIALATIAATLPSARRALRVDPAAALRTE